MLRQIALLSQGGRVIDSSLTLPVEEEPLLADLVVDADFSNALIHPEDRRQFHNAMANGGNTMVEVRHKSGEKMSLRINWIAELNAFAIGVVVQEIQRPFTERQTRVLQLLCRDKTLGEIADALEIKVTTVQTYASRLRERAKVSTNHGLAIWALKTGNV